MTPLNWIEFGVRAAVALGEGVYRLVEAIRAGDVSTTDALSAKLAQPDRILARAEAIKAAQARKAAEEAAQTKKGSGEE